MAHSSVRRECIDLLSVKIIVDMPIPHHLKKENYEEGVIYTYTFNDGGCVFFHEGALMQFDIDTYKPSKVRHTQKCSIYWGREHEKMWKKYVFGGVRLYYCNVNPKCKRKYDDIFRTVKIFKK